MPAAAGRGGAHLIAEGGGVDRLGHRELEANGSATPSQPLSVGSRRSIAWPDTAITAAPMPARSHFAPRRPPRRRARESRERSESLDGVHHE